MLILDEVAGSHVLGSAGNIGTRWPIHATSTGKAWLAFDETGIDRLPETLAPMTGSTITSKAELQPQLTEIRRRGYAVTVDEVEEGFTAIATIIRGVLGDVLGALSIGGPTQRLTATRRAELGVTLCRAAQRLNPEY
jgi:DNA-binding IclR family transcriptional regulator